MKTNNLTTKRFVIRKSLLDTNTVITFTNKTKYTQHFKKSLKVCHVFKSIKVTLIQILYQSFAEN